MQLIVFTLLVMVGFSSLIIIESIHPFDKKRPKPKKKEKQKEEFINTEK